MPEANVGPLLITKAQVEEVRASLPELPDARHERLRSQYHLSVRDVNVLTRLNAEDDAAGPCLVPRLDGWEYKSDAVDFFEALVRLECAPQVAANWTIHLLPKHLGAAGVPFCHNPIPPVVIAELIHLLSEEMITRTYTGQLIQNPRRNLSCVIWCRHRLSLIAMVSYAYVNGFASRAGSGGASRSCGRCAKASSTLSLMKSLLSRTERLR